MTHCLRVFLCFLGIVIGSASNADEYSPAYLELTQVNAQDYQLLWKVPAVGEQRSGLHIILPEDVITIIPVRSSFVGNAYIDYSTIRKNDGFEGSEISIGGLLNRPTDVLVRIERLDSTTEILRLSAINSSFVMGASPTKLELALSYVVFGIEHIWEGIDHLLFVACLIFIAGSWRRILITITGFTVAHSITLTLATLEIVRLPVPPIEATIALSIVFLAREIALKRRDTLTWRYPIAVSSSFGLLHGFGFASALADIGLPQVEIPAALVAFNVGVETGQILFVMLIISIAKLITYLTGCMQTNNGKPRNSLEWVHATEKPLAYLVGSITMVWTLERVMQFWA